MPAAADTGSTAPRRTCSATSTRRRRPRRIQELAIPDYPLPTTLREGQRPLYQVADKWIDLRPALGVARAWTEFAASIHEQRDISPTLYDTYRNHAVWDAAEASARERRWVDVTY